MPRAATINETFNGHSIAVHLPVAIAAASDIGQGLGTSLHDLSGRDLKFDAVFEGDSQPLVVVMDGTDESYAHVLQMSAISPRFAKVNPKCLDSVPPPNLVTARVHLTAGSVSSFELRNDAQSFPPSEALARRVAHRMRCRLSKLNSLTLRATRFDNTSDVLRISFRPPEGARAKLILGNLCDDDLHEFLGAPSPGAGKGKQIDHDFVAYYRLAQEDASSEPIGTLPVPEASVGAAGKTRCNRVELEL
jgi:hypothetical protein